MIVPAIQRTADHVYLYNGNRYPGVTTVLKVLDKSGPLMAWAARQTAEAALDMALDNPDPLYWTLTKLLGSVGREGTVKALTSRANWKRDEAAALGTDVHGLADLIARGQPLPELTETNRARVEHYARWWEASGWTLTASEAMVVNPEWGYGGTLDLYARDRDNRRVLADVKTGKAVYREAVLQETAYGAATLIQTDAGLFTMAPPDRYVVLHVTAEGVREVEINVSALELTAWGACLDLHQWGESMKGKKL